MVDTARQLLDELMGRNRNLDPASAQSRKINWDDPEFCLYFLVKFCPHDLFVNTRADLGQCPKVHDEEAKRLYVDARPSVRKRHFEDEFMRFSNHMLSEVDRKIAKGKQRLQLMNKGEPAPVYVSKYQDQLNNLSARIKKLIGEAEEAGNRGDVDQAQGLMTLCDQLKDEKDALIRQHEADGGTDTSASTTAARPSDTGKSATIVGEKPAAAAGGSSSPPTDDRAQPPPPPSLSAADGSERSANGGERNERRGRRGDRGDGTWQEFTSTEKQMEVCEVCGAFLIVGDAQQRLEDHLTGKQHMGYSRLRRAVDEMYEKRKQEREEEDRLRDADRKHKFDGNGGGGGGVRENKFSRRRDDESRRVRRDDRDRRDSRSSGAGDRRDRGDQREHRGDRHREHRREDHRDHRERNRSRSNY